MKVTVFNGSPAGKESATNVIAEAFLRGAAAAGVQTRNIFLADHKLEQCRGCFSCWFRTPGSCVIADDMDELIQYYNESDIVCFGTPVYTWNMTALLKNFADRLAPLKSPKLQERQGKFDLEDARKKTQKFVVLSNCGFPGEHNFDVLRAAMACCDPSLEIYRNCGKLLKTKDPQIKKTVDIWLAAVERAGKEFTESTQIVACTHSVSDCTRSASACIRSVSACGCSADTAGIPADTVGISAETAEALNMPLMSVAEYAAYLGMK